MRFPERSWIGQDARLAPARWWRRKASQSGLFATRTATIENDLQPAQLIMLTGWHIEAVPTGGQNVVNISVYSAKAPAGSTETTKLYWTGVAGAANQIIGYEWAGDLCLMPGDTLVVGATFNAGAAANRADIWAWGYAIPLGTMQAT